MDCLRDASGSFSFALLGKTVLGAMGQMFYSLSLAMGIMITYGSYMKKGDSIERSVRHIEIFDTVIAIVAGLMIVPVVHFFAVKTGVTPEILAQYGGDRAAATQVVVKAAMNEGPGLMFVTLPKVFATLGAGGAWVGFMFFLLVTFAAATSAISLFEACVASVCDVLHLARKPATLFMTVTILFLATFSALGYGAWSGVKLFGLPFLDFFDFAANSVFMPIVAALSCVFVGYVLGVDRIAGECEALGQAFGAKRFYRVMVRYFAPVLVVAILISEICRAFGIGGWKI
jgi:NSS family neurotransmitter:Na+ symporter